MLQLMTHLHLLQQSNLFLTFFFLGVQINNVSFSTIGVSAFDLVVTSVPPSGYPNIFAPNITNDSTQWAITSWIPSLSTIDVWSTFQA